MEAQDEISDFEYDDSEYSDSDEIESMTDALQQSSLSEPESLEAKVARAIPTPEALSNYLFRIRNAPNADDLIIWILEKIIHGRHLESYKLMIPEFFKQAKIYRRETRIRKDRYLTPEIIDKLEAMREAKPPFKFDWAVVRLFKKALVLRALPIVHDLIDHVLDPDYFVIDMESTLDEPKQRKETLAVFRKNAMAFGDFDVIKRFLTGEEEMIRFGEELTKAVRRGDLDAMVPLIAKMLSPVPTKRFIRTIDCETNGQFRKKWMRPGTEAHRLNAMNGPLRAAFERNRAEALRLLLPIYLTCLEDVYAKYPEHKWYSHLVGLSRGTFDGIISREDSMRFLYGSLPRNMRLALLRRVRALDKEKSGEWIAIKAGGKEFKGHKETLRFWSRYFAGLLRPNSTWADHDCVDFGDDIESDVMQALLTFMLKERWVEPQPPPGVDPEMLIEDIITAANYLQMDEIELEISRSKSYRRAVFHNSLQKDIGAAPGSNKQPSGNSRPVRNESGKRPRSDMDFDDKMEDPSLQGYGTGC